MVEAEVIRLQGDMIELTHIANQRLSMLRTIYASGSLSYCPACKQVAHMDGMYQEKMQIDHSDNCYLKVLVDL